MHEKPIDVVVQLLKSHPETDHEFTAHASDPAVDLNDIRSMAGAEAKLTIAYNGIVRQMTAILGHPIFEGAREERGYPPWYDSMRLGYWEKDRHCVYVALRHDQRDLPFVVVYGVTGTNSDLMSEGQTMHLIPKGD